MRINTRQIISGLFLGLAAISSATLAANSAEPKQVPVLAANAPERYIVVPGDTLWGIASKFLKDPWRWHELFQLNKADIRNPQLIYPGQVLVLDRSGATPQLVLENLKLSPQIRSEQIKKPVWTISPEAIEPFMGKPLVLEEGALDNAARVVGIQDNRVIAGARDHIYVTNVDKTVRDWQIFRSGEALIDPETQTVLGHEALFLGTARQLSETKPADFLVQTSKQEIQVEDRLLPAPKTEIINYLPHAPAKAVKGQVLGLAGGVAYAGRNNVVSINRGKADGLELGHVLAIDRAGDKVQDRFKGERTDYQLPEQRNGLIFIFRVFERISYGLVMEAARPVQRGDSVRNP